MAVNRREYENQEQHNPSQAITLDQALAAYTTGVQAMREGSQSKSFDIGAEFDAVMLDTNIFEISSMQIAKAKILATYKSGQKIF